MTRTMTAMAARLSEISIPRTVLAAIRDCCYRYLSCKHQPPELAWSSEASSKVTFCGSISMSARARLAKASVLLTFGLPL